MAHHARQFFRDLAFSHVEAPIITFSDCEGGGDVFELVPPAPTPSQTPTIDRSAAFSSSPDGASTATHLNHRFFGGPAFATVSAQLHLEALCLGLTRVYTLAPAFRAERSQTARHLAEFWMLEAEVAFVDSLDQVMDLTEDLVKAVAGGVCSSSGSADDVALIRNDRPFNASMLAQRWPRIPYSRAVDLLRSSDLSLGLRAIRWGDSLSSAHEKWLADHFGGPVFVVDFPATLKPFYMRPAAEATTVACFDLLAPGIGELAGGSLREERLPVLEQSIVAKGLDPVQYDWYLDLRRHGTVPHGGFGLGWERLVAWITGHENVRECIAFPRTFNDVRCA